LQLKRSYLGSLSRHKALDVLAENIRELNVVEGRKEGRTGAGPSVTAMPVLVEPSRTAAHARCRPSPIRNTYTDDIITLPLPSQTLLFCGNMIDIAKVT
jgi:hypothetical protein